LILEKISKEIMNWPGVTTDQHRFGGTEFRIGKREIGHIGDRLADLPFRCKSSIQSSHIPGTATFLNKWGETTKFLGYFESAV